MGRGPKYVDYGPMALPVGDIAPSAHAHPGNTKFQEDALRLRSILSIDTGRAQSLHDDATRSANTSEETPREWAQSAEEWLGHEIERLWVNDGAHGAREVRMKLSELVIPGTWVRISTHAGDLIVELSCANAGTCQWLCKAASRLAADVCKTLRRSVRVVVLDRDARQAAAARSCFDSGETP